MGRRKIKIGDIVVLTKPAPGAIGDFVSKLGKVVDTETNSVAGNLCRVKTDYAVALWFYSSTVRLAKPTDILRAKLTGTTVDDTNI
jgi:hypothetical protein